MARCRMLRSLSFVAVVDMAEVATEGCETIKESNGEEKIKRRRLKNERGTTTRRRFSPMQAGRGETINKKTNRCRFDPLEQRQRRGSNKYE